jgi:hypothetical protein
VIDQPPIRTPKLVIGRLRASAMSDGSGGSRPPH